jgi:hypothetical protein
MGSVRRDTADPNEYNVSGVLSNGGRGDMNGDGASPGVVFAS